MLVQVTCVGACSKVSTMVQQIQLLVNSHRLMVGCQRYTNDVMKDRLNESTLTAGVQVVKLRRNSGVGASPDRRYLCWHSSSHALPADTDTMAQQAMIEQAVASVASVLERQIDSEIKRLDNLGEDDLETIRKQRVADMRRKQEKSKEWLAKGHGEYNEVATEKEFFETMKGEERMICHFYRENWPCKVRARVEVGYRVWCLAWSCTAMQG